jgi:hypothetical protein
MPLPVAAFAAKGGFKLGKFLVNQGRAAWGRAKESGFQLSSGATEYSRKATPTAPGKRAAMPGGGMAEGSTMDYMKYAPYAIGALLLLMMKK